MSLEFTAENLAVGSGNVFHRKSGSMSSAVAGGSGQTSAKVRLNPTTDVTKFNVGDVLTVGAQTTYPRISRIDTAAGDLYFDVTMATAASADAVVQLWRNLGATDGDITFNASVEKTLQYVDQSIFAVAAVDTKGTCGIEAPLADITLENLALALGSDPSAITTPSAGRRELLVGAPRSTAREDEFLVTGPGISGKLRSTYLPRTVSMSAVAGKNSKTNKQIVNLKTEALFSTTTGGMARMSENTTFKYDWP